MVAPDQDQKRQDIALGVGLLALGIAFGAVLFLAYDARMGLRFPGLLASLLLVLYGFVIISRAGLPRESTESSRSQLGWSLVVLGGWLALVGLRAVHGRSDLGEPVIYVSYVTGFILFVFGGWLALVSQDPPEEPKPKDAHEFVAEKND